MSARRPTVEIYPDPISIRKLSRLKILRALMIGTLVVTVLLLLLSSVVIIPANHVGIVTLFGRPQSRTLDNGIHLLNPFAAVTKVTLQLREYTLPRINALTVDGLRISVECTAWYRVDPNQAIKLFLDLGTFYEDAVVRPAIQVSVRKVIAMHKAQDLHGTDRALIEQQIQEALQGLLREKYLLLDRTFIQDVAPGGSG